MVGRPTLAIRSNGYIIANGGHQQHRWLEWNPVKRKFTMKTATRGCCRTLKTTQKYRWEHFWGRALGDRAPTDPKGVPWDQNFGSNFFFIWSCNDAILCILLICFAKFWVLCQKQLILLIFFCYGSNNPKFFLTYIFGYLQWSCNIPWWPFLMWILNLQNITPATGGFIPIKFLSLLVEVLFVLFLICWSLLLCLIQCK